MSASCAIVLAAGRGERFGTTKQFERIAGARLVDHAVAAAQSACDDVVVVLPPGHQWAGAAVRAAVTGGASRAASVRAGLASVGDQHDVVVVTDAAHPVAAPALYQRVIDRVRAGASAVIPGVEPVDVIKQVEHDHVVLSLPRSATVVTQVPQAFRTDVLRRAHAGGGEGTEDSAMVAALGLPVTVVEGDPANIHVTDRLTLAFAELLLTGGVQ